MEHLLTPDKGLIIWTIVTFCVLVLLLGKVAWKPLLQALQDREESIRKAIEDATRAKQGAEELKAQYSAELAKAQDQTQTLLNQAKADGQKLRDQMLKDTQAEAKRLMDQTRAQLEEERSRLGRELRQDVAGLSVKVAEKLLRQTINAKEQERLVQGFLNDLEKDTKTN